MKYNRMYHKKPLKCKERVLDSLLKILRENFLPRKYVFQLLFLFFPLKNKATFPTFTVLTAMDFLSPAVLVMRKNFVHFQGRCSMRVFD